MGGQRTETEPLTGEVTGPLKTLLIDYSSILYRAYFSLPDSLPLRGAHGFLGMLARILKDRSPDRLGIAVDEDWRPAFRVEALPEYKAQRVSDEPDPIAPHEEMGRKILLALGVCVVGAEGYEAEDVIATLTRRTDGEVEILSGDRDLFALVRDPDVKVLYPRRGTSQLWEVDEAEICRKFGVPGRRYLDYALLRGDPSDNLPGVVGIGEKTASRLISEYGSLEALLASDSLSPSVAKKLDPARDYLAAARRVVPPATDVPLPAGLYLGLPERPANPEELQRLADEHRLNKAIDRARQALGI